MGGGSKIEVMVKKTEKLTHSDNQVERYLGVLSENFSDKVKVIGEQYSHLIKKIDEVQNTQKSHTEMIGGLAVDVETLKDDMKVVKGDIVILKDDVKVMKGDIVILKDDMVVVKSDLQIIKTDVEPRVARLEAGGASRG